MKGKYEVRKKKTISGENTLKERRGLLYI